MISNWLEANRNPSDAVAEPRAESRSLLRFERYCLDDRMDGQSDLQPQPFRGKLRDAGKYRVTTAIHLYFDGAVGRRADGKHPARGC